MKTHPERKPDEEFIGNVEDGVTSHYLDSLKTIRLGKVAFEALGKKLPARLHLRLLEKNYHQNINHNLLKKANTLTIIE